MPCLIITGYPSSGKTSIAEMISERALNHHSKSIQRTMIVNEESIYSSSTKSNNNNNNNNKYPPEYIKQRCYDNSNAEKETRAALKTEFDKHASTASSTKTLVILDSLNYIKGYRYELHCISKAVGERHGIVWVVCPPKLAFQWNQNRIEQYMSDKNKANEDGKDEEVSNSNQNKENDEKDSKLFYTQEMMEGLMKRYETPDNRNRWDKPLYKIELSTLIENLHSDDQCEDDKNQNMSYSVAKDVLEKSVYNMHSLSDAIEDNTSKPSNSKVTAKNDETTDKSKLEARIDTILDAFLECKPLKEGLSTQKPIVAASNVLHQVDAITKKITTSICKAQQNLPLGSPLSVLSHLPSSSKGKNKTITFHRRVNLPELRRWQRQYVKWVSSHPPNDTSELGISESFLDYLDTQTG